MVKIHFIFRESAVNRIGRAERALSRAPVGRLRSSLQHSAHSSYNFIIRRINRVGREPMQSLNRGVLFAQNCAKGALFEAKNTPIYPSLKMLITFFFFYLYTNLLQAKGVERGDEEPKARLSENLAGGT